MGLVQPNLITSGPKGGLAQITVRAYNAQGKLLTSTTTDTTGHHRLNLPVGQRVRVEFSEVPQNFTLAPGQARVQFVTSPAEVNLRLWQPGQYLGAQPRAVQVLYTNSQTVSGKGDSFAALVTVGAGSANADSSAGGQAAVLATSAGVGTLWGLAYERNSKRLFAAAFAKRHSGFGPLGAGGIYVNDTQQPLSTRSFVDLAALGIPVAPAGLNHDLIAQTGFDNGGTFNHDSLMFSLVGKMGLGGLDVSDDGGHLWVMNLYNRTLYRIALPADGHTPGAADVIGFAVPNPGYRRGEQRPFAVKYYGGSVYVGVVNDAAGTKATPADLRATVLAFDPGRETFSEVFSMALDYKRGTLGYGVSGWRAWTDDYLQTLHENKSWMIYPQPMLADIEFDTDGAMILSLMDRLGHQTGEGQLYRPKGSGQLQQVRGLAGGDVLRVAFRPEERGEKRYELEHDGQAGDRITAGHGNGPDTGLLLKPVQQPLPGGRVVGQADGFGAGFIVRFATRQANRELAVGLSNPGQFARKSGCFKDDHVIQGELQAR